ncbi:hypothetical protein [Streptomyces murinus]|uniref:hypothetical protein n=1 Tax=Streptomyces murinus TaxID=33900 RepID=UPI00380CFA2B
MFTAKAPAEEGGAGVLEKWSGSKLGAGLPPGASPKFNEDFWGPGLANALNTGAGALKITPRLQVGAKPGKFVLHPSLQIKPAAGLPTSLGDASTWVGMIVFNVQKLCEINTKATQAICGPILHVLGKVDQAIRGYQTDIMSETWLEGPKNISWGRRANYLYNEAGLGNYELYRDATRYLERNGGDVKPLTRAWQINYGGVNAWSSARPEPYTSGDWHRLHEATIYAMARKLMRNMDKATLELIDKTIAETSDPSSVRVAMSEISNILNRASDYFARVAVSATVHDFYRVRDDATPESTTNAIKATLKVGAKEKQRRVEDYLRSIHGETAPEISETTSTASVIPPEEEKSAEVLSRKGMGSVVTRLESTSSAGNIPSTPSSSASSISNDPSGIVLLSKGRPGREGREWPVRIAYPGAFDDDSDFEDIKVTAGEHYGEITAYFRRQGESVMLHGPGDWELHVQYVYNAIKGTPEVRGTYFAPGSTRRVERIFPIGRVVDFGRAYNG